MEKSAMDRDLDDWEFIGGDSFIELGDAGHLEAGKGAFGAPGAAESLLLLPGPAKGKRSEAAAEKTNQDEEDYYAAGIAVAPPGMRANQEVGAQVFLRKMGDEEYVDLKLQSPPRSPTARILKQLPVREGGGEGREDGSEEKKTAKMVEEEEKQIQAGRRGCCQELSIGIWKWKITGMGALCSLGMAAATFCIFVLGGHQRRHRHHHPIEKLDFKIYQDKKSAKQVVQQATRINQAISAVRGVPMPRGHAASGGLHDAL